MASDIILINPWPLDAEAPELRIVNAWKWCVDHEIENLAFAWLILQTCLNLLAIENPTGPHTVLYDPGPSIEKGTFRDV